MSREEFEKVDRALEIQVIDWLQFGEFEENLLKNPDDSDMAQLTLTLINKRKKYCETLEQKLHVAVEALEYYASRSDDHLYTDEQWDSGYRFYHAAENALKKIKGTK